MSDSNRKSRREFLASAFAGIGLLASYGLLAGEGLLFLLPGSGKAKTRKLYAGQIDQFEIGSVRTFYDLSGNEILLKRSADGFQAFDSTCPHLGCKVRWQNDKERFHCPCHNSSFSLEGKRAPDSPSPRDLDKMVVDEDRLKKTGEIAIRFVNYYPGKEDRIPK